MNWEPAMNGVPSTTSEEVARLAQTSSGIRQKLMPGARMVTMVTRKFTAVAIDDAPADWTPITQKGCPRGPWTERLAEVVPPAGGRPPREGGSKPPAGPRRPPKERG